MRATTAPALWAQLSADRAPVLVKAERYAALTIPTLLLPEGQSSDKQEVPHDFQSLGAQAVNHLTNKLMLAMFSPSRPAMRLELTGKTAKEAQANGLDSGPALAIMERQAALQLDKKALRPQLYKVFRHLIVTGNMLQLRENEAIRVFSLRAYCVKRTITGKIHTLVVKENICADELEKDVREAAGIKADDEKKVDFYRLVRLQEDGRWEETKWVDDVKLGDDFTSLYTEATMPWDALCWSRADDSNYGVGHVEEYAGDFEALSVICESLVDGVVVGTEVRWLVSPTGVTQLHDVKDSKNGDVLAGRPEDLGPVNPNIRDALEIALKVEQHWEQRIARAFLLQSAVTRQAERVTAEEIRITAMELETALGGVYSFLSVELQLPLSRWLLDLAGYPLKGADIEVTIITGLEALSRGGDLMNLMQAFDVLGKVAQLPPMLQARIKFEKLATDVGAGFQVDLKPYLMNDDEFAKAQADSAAARASETVATEAGVSAVQAPA